MNYIQLSKKIAYILRHHPEKYDLVLNEEGFVAIDQLLEALHSDASWQEVTVDDIKTMIKNSEKKRFEIKNGQIRAYYGHTIATKITKQEQTPPDVLYHGTAIKFLESIKEKGLLPQKRQYVHLSCDTKTAYDVAIRHSKDICILKIDTKKAMQSGIKFYYGNEDVWLSDKIPMKFIEIKK